MGRLTDADARAIRNARDELVSAILAGDADAYARAFASDGIVMHPDTPLVQGSAALLDYAKAVFGAVKITKLNLETLSLGGDGDVAYEVGVQDVRVQPADPHFKEKRQYLHAYHRQSDGTWRIAAAMSGNQ